MDDEGLLIAVFCDRDEILVARHLRSLRRCAAELRALGAEVLLLNGSSDRARLDEAVAGAQGAFPCRIAGDATGAGFIRATNIALTEAARRRRDVLVLRSEVVLLPGVIREMVRVALVDPMTGFVTPRAPDDGRTQPDRFLGRSPEEIAEAQAALARHLPEFTYVPAPQGFCLLVKWRILAEMGCLDEIYAMGVDAVEDLAMRAGRCGYRTLRANHAWVWCADGPVEGPARSTILFDRYPELASLTRAHFQAPESDAERLLGTLRPDRDGLLDLALDFSTFVPSHNGTMKAGRQLLRAAVASWRDRFRIHVLCSEATFGFHGYASLGVERRDPNGPERFAVIFRVGVPYNLATFERLARKGLVIGVYMLDTIPIDCTHYTSQTLFNVWQLCLSHIDQFATTSELSMRQFRRRFEMPPELVLTKALHSLDVGSYRLALETPPGAVVAGLPPGYLLVIGNRSWHKFVAPTANRLAAALPERRVVAFGAATPEEPLPDAIGGQYPPSRLLTRENLRAFADGAFGDADMGHLYANAVAIVFPSHYEGFGFPILEALAMRKPVLVRRLPVFEELRGRLGDSPNIHFYDTTEELVLLAAAPPGWVEAPYPSDPYGALDMANDIRRGFERALASVRYDRVVERLRAVQLTHARDQTVLEQGAGSYLVDRYVKRAAAALRAHRVAYGAARFVYRLLRGPA